ncbi:MAG TPA: hypothetical protein VG097_12485 [Gemmata sp.]|nr:hypothetical protein [Gemmata sp.]
MSTTSSSNAGLSEAGILARLMSDGLEQVPSDISRYILEINFPKEDKARMHDLAVRNQSGALSAAEREELFAYAKAGTVLSILKVKARRILGMKPKKRTRS